MRPTSPTQLPGQGPANPLSAVPSDLQQGISERKLYVSPVAEFPGWFPELVLFPRGAERLF